MNVLKPQALRAGDSIGLVSPSASFKESARPQLEACQQIFREKSAIELVTAPNFYAV